MAASKSRCLFHYTTGEGLVSIVKSQSLHATHSDFLNDPSECRLLREILTPVFQRELGELVPKLIQRGVFQKKILEEMGRHLYTMESENIFRALVATTNRTSPFFISSFCLHEPESEQYEHGRLSQWRAYARGGFALEFDELELDELHKKEQEKHAYLAIMTNTVEYDKHQERANPQKFAGVAKAMMREVAAKAKQDASDLTGKQELDEYWRPYVEAAPFLKDPSFHEENEYRLVAVCFGPAIKEAGVDRPRKQIAFKTLSNNNNVPRTYPAANMQSLKSALSVISVIGAGMWFSINEIAKGHAALRVARGLRWLGGVPVDKYHVVVTRLHVASWEWEIYRNSEPLPVRMRDGPYKSVRTAESVGSVALREFLQALNREKSLAVNPRPLLGRPPRRPPPWAAPVNGLSWLPLPSKSYRQAA